MRRFVYKLIPPRPTFDADMNQTEAATMSKHFAYWQDQLATGTVVIYGPVQEDGGTWGLAIVEADQEAEVRTIGDADPAVSSGMATYQVWPMATSIVRG